MIDYSTLLRNLADNPPDSATERQVHASMLELIASCMREEAEKTPESLSELRARYSRHDEPSVRTH